MAWRRLRHRVGWLDHLVRAGLRYDEADGGRLAAAVTYYSFFATFALGLLGFAVFGFILDDPAVLRSVERYVAEDLPHVDMQTLRNARNTAGIIAFIGLPITGWFWIDVLRSSIRKIWRLPEYPGKLVVRVLVDLLVLTGLGILLGASLSVAYLTTSVANRLVDAADTDATPSRWVLATVGLLLGIGVNTVLAGGMLTGLPRVRMPLRRILGPALLVAVGLELLKTLGRLYVQRTEANPTYHLVAGSVGLLVFLNAVNQLVLFAAALTATSTAGRPADLAADGENDGKPPRHSSDSGRTSAPAGDTYAADMEPTRGTSVLGMLTAAEDASPVQAVEAVTRGIAAALDANSVSFLIADLSGRALVRLAHHSSRGPSTDRRDGDEVASVIPFDGGIWEQALRSQAVQVIAGDDEWTALAPVTERGEVIGLLEVCLPAEPGPATVTEIASTAHVLAFVVIANRRHTDLFEWGQRTTQFSLSAEIQRRLLPSSFTCEGGSFTLSGWLEPAASVGGDTFDYSIARDTLHFSVTDAMGHAVASALTATLGVGSLRNARRAGSSLVEQADVANAAVAQHAGPLSTFVTAMLGRLDLSTGVCALLNAGHVPPLLVRDGDPQPVKLPRSFPLGMFPEGRYRSAEVALQPGDRLVIVTDGVQDRHAAELDLPAQLRRITDLHPREAARALADAVLELAGPTLADDATLLIIDWHGQHGRPRNSSAGADRSHATSADPR